MDHAVLRYLVEVVTLILATGFLLFIIVAGWSILFRHFPIWKLPPTLTPQTGIDTPKRLAPGERLRRSILFRHFPIWKLPPTEISQTGIDTPKRLAPGERLRRNA
jgi:hypothetical protein